MQKEKPEKATPKERVPIKSMAGSEVDEEESVIYVETKKSLLLNTARPFSLNHCK